MSQDLPDGPVVRNLPANAGHPWSGEVQHALEKRSSWATATKAHAPIEPMACNKRDHRNGKLRTTKRGTAWIAKNREGPRAAVRIPCGQK